MTSDLLLMNGRLVSIINKPLNLAGICVNHHPGAAFTHESDEPHLYLVGTGGLVRAVVIAEVLVGFGGLGLSVDAGVRLVDGRDVVTQGDGLHSLVDATADALADFWTRRLGLAGRR